MAQDWAEEEIKKLNEKIEEYKAEREQLIKERDEARDALEEEKKQTEYERGRMEQERDRWEKERRRRREEEEGEKLKKIWEELRYEKKEKMSLKERLRLEREEKTRYENRAIEYQTLADNERRRNEGLSDEVKKQEEKMKEMKEIIAQQNYFKKRCVDILTGEMVDRHSLIEFIEMVAGNRFTMHVAVSLGMPWLVEHVKSIHSHTLKAKNHRGWTPLVLATALGNTSNMQRLWHSKDLQMDIPLLHVAAANRQYSAAMFLKNTVDKSTTYKGHMACQLAFLVGDKPLAKKIKPKGFFGFQKVPMRCDLRIEDIDELMLNPPPLRTSVNTRSGTNRSPEFSTRLPIPPSPSPPPPPLLKQGGIIPGYTKAEERGEGSGREEMKMGIRKREHDDDGAEREERKRRSKKEKKEKQEEEKIEKQEEEKKEKQEDEKVEKQEEETEEKQEEQKEEKQEEEKKEKQEDEKVDKQEEEETEEKQEEQKEEKQEEEKKEKQEEEKVDKQEEEEKEKKQEEQKEEKQEEKKEEKEGLDNKAYHSKSNERRDKTVTPEILKPRDQKPEVRPPLGLPNLGNTCYMNSVVQCLYHTTPLAARLRELEQDKTQGEVVKATVKVMVALHRRENPNGDIKGLKRVAGQKDAMYAGFEQKEAHDFLSQMLEWLHWEMPLPQEEEKAQDREVVSFISKLFHGTHLSTITCKEVPRTVICSTHETFSNLSLTVTQPTTLEEALEQYYRTQELEWECGRCRREHMCEQKVSLTKSPPVLVLHLNRSNHPDHSSRKAEVFYPPLLDVKLNSAASSKKYSLFAVCCHDGGMYGGHYTAYCRSGDQWYYFNDTIVRRTTQENVLEKPSAHILFYEAEESPL